MVRSFDPMFTLTNKDPSQQYILSNPNLKYPAFFDLIFVIRYQYRNTFL